MIIKWGTTSRVTNWGGHIDVLVGVGIIIFVQMVINWYLWSKINKVKKTLTSLRMWYGKN